ncbi:MAG: hypothetical protein BGO49_13995 [Planctomycetales bacterium 71-10]|nr:MAG: hypothetical protein BGO49_13995 [Planctomycetales bacterium 71-10]
MSAPRQGAIRAEHRRATRACATWAAVVPASTLPLVFLGPIVGISLFALAAVLSIRTRRGVAHPCAYGAFHWRLVAEAFRDATRPALVVGGLAAATTSALKAAPGSAAAAVAAVTLGVVPVFSTAYALGAPREVAFDHAVELLLERRAGRGVRYETGLLLMRRSEDVDRRAVALFGEPLIAAMLESLPPFDAAFDGPPEADGPLDRLAPLADSFHADPDPELAEALREVASVVEAARADGIRCRLVAVPPYPCAQALDLMGSTRRYA